MYEVVGEAVKRAREGAGPTLIECKTYRYHPHCSEVAEERDPDEIRRWHERDPIPRFEQYLLDQQIMTEAEQSELRQQAKEAVEQAVAFGEASSWPDPATVAEYLWA